GHLGPQQPERVDQERLLAGHAQGDVVVDRFRPAKQVEDAVAGGKVLAGGPFGLAALDLALELGGHVVSSVAPHPSRSGLQNEFGKCALTPRLTSSFRLASHGARGRAGWRKSLATASRWAGLRRPRSWSRTCARRSITG